MLGVTSKKNTIMLLPEMYQYLLNLQKQYEEKVIENKNSLNSLMYKYK